MRLDLRKVADYMRRADTEDLLDRVTVYREEMEPAAVDLIEGELARRGFTPEEISEHERDRGATIIFQPDGSVLRCHFCNRPAVSRGRGWNRFFGLVPIYPRLFAYCDVHGNPTDRGDRRAGEQPLD